MKFFSSEMIPSFSKDNSGFFNAITPYRNFLVYQGLIRCGVYDLASEIAAKSSIMWTKHFKKHFEVFARYYSYNPFSLKSLKSYFSLKKSSEKQSLSGNLLALIGISEIADIELWRDDLKPSLRFGTALNGDNRVDKYFMFNEVFSVRISDSLTEVNLNGHTVISGEGGKFIIRNYVEKEEGAEFTIKCFSEIILQLALPILGVTKDAASIQLSLKSGAFKVKIIKGKPFLEKIN
jgi:hypothetical protein